MQQIFSWMIDCVPSQHVCLCVLRADSVTQIDPFILHVLPCLQLYPSCGSVCWWQTEQPNWRKGRFEWCKLALGTLFSRGWRHEENGCISETSSLMWRQLIKKVEFSYKKKNVKKKFCTKMYTIIHCFKFKTNISIIVLCANQVVTWHAGVKQNHLS